MINSNGSTDQTDQTDQPIKRINQTNQINNGVEIMDKTIFTAEAGGVSLQGRLEGMDHLRKPYEGTLAVLFPGRSYPSTAPLLYYSDRLFLEHQIPVLKLDYGNLPWNQDSREMADGLIQKILRDAGADRFAKLIFIAASIGTVFATDIIQAGFPKACAILFAPIDGALEGMKGISFLAFSGSEDPLLTVETARLHLDASFGSLEFLPKADHHLTLVSAMKTMAMHQHIMAKTEAFLLSII